ncbi:TIR domain-containing protein [Gorillibacterium massiliense]|uniref:TIR domain-containing protein n=1 Tax=Gorillibacterium massiliense TaxID=1280390 RepID=UPI0004ADB486|nr:TIR domain-containing protein [Gorillibacterium massiliense]
MTIDQPKPNVFIGCSREAIDYARAISGHLERVAQVNPWYADTFGANSYTMEALEQELENNDFGVFVFATDDVALIRDKYAFVTRDNTLFEMGLFWGRLGRKRVFCMIPREIVHRDDLVDGENITDFHILSDLTGITLLSYGLRTDGKYAAAVDVACGELIKAIHAEQRYKSPHILLDEQRLELERKQSILRFFWEYNRNIKVKESGEKYLALSEAIRNSFLPPPSFRITGAAIWKQLEQGRIGQVGGNVGKGRVYWTTDNSGSPGEDQKIYVIDVFATGKWAFFKRQEIVEVYVLCYPLGKDFVLSTHISGTHSLNEDELAAIVELNAELLITAKHLLGGDLF